MFPHFVHGISMDFPLKKHTCFYIYIYIDIRCWILSCCVVRLYQAARVGDEKLVEELIQKDANLEECGRDDKDGRFRIRFLIGSGWVIRRWTNYLSNYSSMEDLRRSSWSSDYLTSWFWLTSINILCSVDTIIISLTHFIKETFHLQSFLNRLNPLNTLGTATGRNHCRSTSHRFKWQLSMAKTKWCKCFWTRMRR